MTDHHRSVISFSFFRLSSSLRDPFFFFKKSRDRIVSVHDSVIFDNSLYLAANLSLTGNRKINELAHYDKVKFGQLVSFVD